jgi:hypothetical protein
MAAGIFDLNTPLDFFNSIRQIIKRYKSNKVKDIEELLYIIMGLNHLREWIAPGYDLQKPPKIPEETFSRAIYNTPSHETIRLLCNHSKHI